MYDGSKMTCDVNPSSMQAGWRKRLNDEKVFKSSCHQFRFRELPSVLLPGQSLEFTIVFRSKKPGYFFENLYLLTHPKLRDSEGRGYSLRLSGICMDPEIVVFNKVYKIITAHIQTFYDSSINCDCLNKTLFRGHV